MQLRFTDAVGRAYEVGRVTEFTPTVTTPARVRELGKGEYHCTGKIKGTLTVSRVWIGLDLIRSQCNPARQTRSAFVRNWWRSVLQDHPSVARSACRRVRKQQAKRWLEKTYDTKLRRRRC
jgi:hypothetical protein